MRRNTDTDIEIKNREATELIALREGWHRPQTRRSEYIGKGSQEQQSLMAAYQMAESDMGKE
jgi:hypothetical protein